MRHVVGSGSAPSSRPRSRRGVAARRACGSIGAAALAFLCPRVLVGQVGGTESVLNALSVGIHPTAGFPGATYTRRGADAPLAVVVGAGAAGWGAGLSLDMPLEMPFADRPGAKSYAEVSLTRLQHWSTGVDASAWGRWDVMFGLRRWPAEGQGLFMDAALGFGAPIGGTRPASTQFPLAVTATVGWAF